MLFSLSIIYYLIFLDSRSRIKYGTSFTGMTVLLYTDSSLRWNDNRRVRSWGAAVAAPRLSFTY